MMFKKHVISFALAACVVVSCAFTTGSTFATMTESSRSISWEDKIDSAVWQSAVDENGRYLVYVSRTGISDGKIEKEFNKRNEYPLSYYKDKATYRAKVGSEVAVEALHKYGLDESLSLEYGREIFDDNVAPIEYELLENYNEFVMNKRKVMSDLYGEHNDSFAARVGIDDEAVLYEGMYTGSYVMYASQEEIERIAKDKSVTEVSVLENTPVQPATNSVHEQIHTDSTTGTKSTNFNNGTGYKGTGIKIGIIEAVGEIQFTNGEESSSLMLYFGFSQNSPQLSSIYGKTLFYVNQNNEIDDPVYYGFEAENHANLVTSIIVGQSSTYNGIVYEGVVPNATVYQTNSFDSASTLNKVQTLINKFGVNVINCSFELLDYETSEININHELDLIVANTSVTIVASSGNRHEYVAVPGNTYNVITVGNVYTKNDDGSNVTAPYYAMNESSSYSELNGSTNKPDIVAPGTNIACRTRTGVYADTGTSFAAPLVAGVVAQVLQTDETLLEYPSRVKAMLLAGADPTVISTENNPAKYSDNAFIRDKSGAGMVNAVNSIRIAENFQHSGCTAYFDSTSTLGDNTLKSVYLSAGQTIRVVLTYNRLFDDSKNEIEFDAGLALMNGNTECIGSDHSYCNVEIIEYTATTAGNYDIVAYVDYLYATQDHSSSGIVNVAWRIIN